MIMQKFTNKIDDRLTASIRFGDFRCFDADWFATKTLTWKAFSICSSIILIY